MFGLSLVAWKGSTKGVWNGLDVFNFVAHLRHWILSLEQQRVIPAILKIDALAMVGPGLGQLQLESEVHLHAPDTLPGESFGKVSFTD